MSGACLLPMRGLLILDLRFLLSQFTSRLAEKRRRDDSASFEDDRLSMGTASDVDLPPPRKTTRTSRAPKLAPIQSQVELDQPAYQVPAALYTHDFAPKEEEAEPRAPRVGAGASPRRWMKRSWPARAVARTPG